MQKKTRLLSILLFLATAIVFAINQAANGASPNSALVSVKKIDQKGNPVYRAQLELLTRGSSKIGHPKYVIGYSSPEERFCSYQNPVRYREVVDGGQEERDIYLCDNNSILLSSVVSRPQHYSTNLAASYIFFKIPKNKAQVSEEEIEVYESLGDVGVSCFVGLDAPYSFGCNGYVESAKDIRFDFTALKDSSGLISVDRIIGSGTNLPFEIPFRLPLTDEKGETRTWVRITDDTLTIREVYAPFGYIRTDDEYEVKRDGYNSYKATVINYNANYDLKFDTFKIQKNDDAGEPVAGARFDIYEDITPIVRDGQYYRMIGVDGKRYIITSHSTVSIDGNLYTIALEVDDTIEGKNGEIYSFDNSGQSFSIDGWRGRSASLSIVSAFLESSSRNRALGFSSDDELSNAIMDDEFNLAERFNAFITNIDMCSFINKVYLVRNSSYTYSDIIRPYEVNTNNISSIIAESIPVEMNSVSCNIHKEADHDDEYGFQIKRKLGSYTTNAAGQISVDYLPLEAANNLAYLLGDDHIEEVEGNYGKVIVQETSAPSGYILDSSEKNAKVTDGLFTIVNSRKHINHESKETTSAERTISNPQTNDNIHLFFMLASLAFVCFAFIGFRSSRTSRR